MIYEKNIEDCIILLLKEKGYEYLNSNDHWFSNRSFYDYINKDLFLACLKKINKINNFNILNDTYNKITRLDNPSLFERNLIFHNYLVNGITIDTKELEINPLLKLIDFENPKNNIFQVVNQITYKESNRSRIPDIVIYINGIPLIMMELKTFDEQGTKSTLEDAYLQIGSNSQSNGYRYDIPTLYNYNSFIVISDGVNTKVGTLTSKFDRYSEWKSVNGERGYNSDFVKKINVLIDGLFEKERLLDVIKNNIFFIQDKNEKPIKIMSQYHQYFGVKKAYDSILKSIKPEGSGKAGLLWHTQGSGKSFSMVMLANRLIKSSDLKVPTIVVLTDRIDLDQQLYKTFFSAKNYLRIEPIIATSRQDLVNKLSKLKQGGIILTTVGKFDKDNLPKNERNNIIVMTDEAHRGHYGLYDSIYFEKNKETQELEAVSKYGVEKYIRDALPNATFIGFTGTPVSTKEKQTTDIFGDIIDVYDMTQSIIDGSTVKLYYESRIATVWTNDYYLKLIDDYYKEIEDTKKANKRSIEKSKAEMSKIKVILEDDDMINSFATDILKHYNQRKEFLNGKAMIVCQTRTAALKLYKRIIELSPNLKEETILVVTESNKDSFEEREIYKNSEYRKEIGNEFKKDNSKYKIAIVCDMWLTGYDVPDLDVMYVIKKMRSHNLMQAIARVNRIYQGKTSGLIVDYIGLDKDLDKALKEYTHQDTGISCGGNVRFEIYKILKEKLDDLNEIFKNIGKERFKSKNSLLKFSSIQAGCEFVLKNKQFEDIFMNDISLSIKNAFVVTAGILTEEEKNDCIYYLAIRSYILKLRTNGDIVSIKEMNEQVSKLLKDAIKSDEVKVLKKDDTKFSNIVEILNKEKLEELKKNTPPNIFIEIIKQILERAIRKSRNTNYIKAQEYSKKLRKILEKYNDRDNLFLPETTIVDLVVVANEMIEEENKTNSLGLKGREKAFYDALVKDKTSTQLLNDETLKLIAIELKDIVEKHINTTDWSLKESTRADLRVKIKECLKKYNYPPEYRQDAIEDIFIQAEYIS